jgi:hypothetical protein
MIECVLEGNLLAIRIFDGEGQDTLSCVGIGVNGPVGNDLLKKEKKLTNYQ